MNEIEEKFYEAFIKKGDYGQPKEEFDREIKSRVVIGPYQVDFLAYEKFIIEIDGHESHKTKEQRDYDYKRERYFMKQGYIIIRFTGTEVFLEPEKCVDEMLDIVINFEQDEIKKQEEWFYKGIESTKIKNKA
jgi:Uncharacterized protein conserved in bacteria